MSVMSSTYILSCKIETSIPHVQCVQLIRDAPVMMMFMMMFMMMMMMVMMMMVMMMMVVVVVVW